MSTFNENPFLRETEVKPFSNATEAELWQANNCHKCSKYEIKSERPEDAGCKLAFQIDFGYIAGYIELWAAKEIGCKYDPLYQTCILSAECRERRDENYPF